MQSLNYHKREKKQLSLTLDDNTEMVLSIKRPSITDVGEFDQVLQDIQDVQDKAVKNAKSVKEESEAIVEYFLSVLEHVTEGFDRKRLIGHEFDYLSAITKKVLAMRTGTDEKEKKSE